MMIINFLVSTYFNVVIIYSGEIYETEIRSAALAFINIIGRAVGSSAPFALYELNQIDKIFPYLLLTLVNVIGFVASLFLKVETSKKPLDNFL